MSIERRVIEPPGLSLRKRENARARWRLELALAVSIGLHALLLFLQLGDAGFGLPGLTLPWEERRVQATDIAARLVELPRAPVPLVVVPPPIVTPEVPEPPRVSRPVAPRPPRVARVAPPEAPPSAPRQETAEPAPAAEAQARAPEVPDRPEIIAQTEPQSETFKVPPVTDEAEARRKAEDGRRKEEAARQLAEETTRRKEEAARQQTEAVEIKRKEEEEQARQRALAVQKEQEELKRKAEDGRRKEEEARRIALETEALKRAEDAARQQAAARQKELEAQRQAAEETRRKEEAAKQLAEEGRRKEEAARQAASGPAGAAPAPGAPSGREIAGKALEQLRTPGAAARVDPPRPPLPPVSGDRRRSVFGVERDVVIRMYVDSWRWKIERFGALNYRPSAAWRARDNPVVTVAIRKDGSLESVHIHRSSGVRELDDTVRRIAERYSPYSAFPPALALQYDIIEIRRVWFFDDTLKIMEEM